MSEKQMIITCGNPQCGKRLQINDPEKFLKGVKCPACGYINPLPKQAAVSPDAFSGQELNTVFQSREEAPTGFGTRAQAPAPPAIPGWLIVKDEQIQPKTFTLHMGTNTVGRLSHQNASDHMIDADRHMSRQHCSIQVRLNRIGLLEYILMDGSVLGSGERKTSMNGTYLNGREERLHEQDQVHLKDGDAVQIGITKLVLKTGYTAQTVQQANKNVEEMDYERTVLHFVKN